MWVVDVGLITGEGCDSEAGAGEGQGCSAAGQVRPFDANALALIPCIATGLCSPGAEVAWLHAGRLGQKAQMLEQLYATLKEAAAALEARKQARARQAFL